MIFGIYPCCEEPISLYLPEDVDLPVWEKEKCPYCGEIVWHYLSRVNPHSYTEDDFQEKFIIDVKTKTIKLREIEKQGV